MLATVTLIAALAGAGLVQQAPLPVSALPAGSEGTSPRPQLAAVGIVAQRFPEMLAFYRDVLGFEIEAHDVEGQFVELRSSGVRFQLLAQETMRVASGYDGFDAARSGHSFELAFEVGTPREVDALYARIVAGGGSPIAAPADKPWGQRIAFFADPDGNIHDVYATL